MCVCVCVVCVCVCVCVCMCVCVCVCVCFATMPKCCIVTTMTNYTNTYAYSCRIITTTEVPADFLEPMHGTRPWCLVQAITRHTCPDPDLGSWNCYPYQTHIAPSEPMSRIDQQGSSLGSFPTFSSPLSPL